MIDARHGSRSLVCALAIAGALASRSSIAAAQGLSVQPRPEVTPPRLATDSPATYPARALREHHPAAVKVTLIVDVNAEGAVSGARVKEPQGPAFDKAALEAATHLRFEPARRDGLPVASKIEFRYVFAPPLAKMSGRVSSFESDRPIAGAAVTATDAGGTVRSVTTGADGTWALSDLLPGPVHLRVVAAGRTPTEADQPVASGEETIVVDRLRLAGAVEARLDEVVVHGTRPPREVTKRTLSQEELDHTPGTR